MKDLIKQKYPNRALSGYFCLHPVRC